MTDEEGLDEVSEVLAVLVSLELGWVDQKWKRKRMDSSKGPQQRQTLHRLVLKGAWTI